MNVTEHFRWDEAMCKDGTPVPAHLKDNAIKVAQNIEVLRRALGGVPIHVNSWYRTPSYNKSIGGAPKSQHLEAKAMDIWVTGIKPITLYTVIEVLIRMGKMDEGGLGLYNSFVHYDCPRIRSRWNLQT